MSRPSIAAALLLVAVQAAAVPTRYTSQALFEADLATLGASAIHEGFEDDAVWGDYRTPSTTYSVTTQGITFTANGANSGITTGSGPARTGQYGFFELPHGDWQNGITDGWVFTSEAPMLGAGGWIETNTYGARVDLIVDDTTVVDFEDIPVDYAHRFYGVIDPDGFTRLEVTETEAVANDQWFYIFADDFYFGLDTSTAVPGAAAAAARLLPNVPNPFNPATQLRFELDAPAPVTIRVYDTAGRQLRVLGSGETFAAGSHALRWDGRDAAGRALPSGVYLYRLEAGGIAESRRMTLLK